MLTKKARRNGHLQVFHPLYFFRLDQMIDFKHSYLTLAKYIYTYTYMTVLDFCKRPKHTELVISYHSIKKYDPSCCLSRILKKLCLSSEHPCLLC